MSTMSTVLSVRLNPETKEKLEKIAKSSRRSKSFLAAEAIEEFVRYEAWKIEQIEEGIRQADARMGIPHEEVMASIRARIDQVRQQRKAG